MWPTLISVGPIVVHSFGVMLGLGFFFGGFVWWHKGKEEGLGEEALMDSWLITGLSSLVAGRLGQILFHWEEFSHSWYKMLFFTKFPGVNYESAWLGAIGVMVILCFKKGFNLWQTLDMSMFSLLTVEIFGGIGVLLGGGRLNWLLQIIWLVSLMVLYRLLMKWEKVYRTFGWFQRANGETEPGFLIGVYFLITGGLKTALGLGAKISFFQWWGAGLMLIGGLILLIRSGKLNQSKAHINNEPEVKAKVKLQRKKRGFDFK